MNIYKAIINRISEIFADIGQVCLGSLVIPFLQNKINQFVIIKLLVGLFICLIFWIASVLLVNSSKYG